MSDPVIDLDARKVARLKEVQRLNEMRPFVVTIVASSVAVMPPGAGPDDTPRTEVFDAADLASDPGRLGEIARAMLAAMDRSPAQGQEVQHAG